MSLSSIVPWLPIEQSDLAVMVGQVWLAEPYTDTKPDQVVLATTSWLSLG